MVMQVCQQLHNENKEREIRGLLEAMDFFDLKSGMIVTQRQSDILRFDKKIIELKPAHQFLMEEV